VRQAGGGRKREGKVAAAMTQKVWRDYDQAGLDRQLNLRARWPHFAEVFARWAAASALAREQLPRRLDLAYGPTPGQTLDFFPAAGAGPAPLMIFIHGGYWQFLDKSDVSYLAPPFVEAGIAFAALNYDLAPKVSLSTMIEQIERAVAWLGERAAQFGCDRTRLVLAGHSAGGHLATLALIRDSLRSLDGGPPRLLAGGCSVSGVYDLVPIRRCYHNSALKLTEGETARLSPLRLQPPTLAPLIVAVGGGETEEFLAQQAALQAQWRALELPLAVVELEQRDHFHAADALGESQHPLHQAAVALCRGGSA